MFLNQLERTLYLWKNKTMFCALNQEAREEEKTVALVGDPSIGKTKKLCEISGCDAPKKKKVTEYSLVLCGGTKFVRVLDVQGACFDTSAIKDCSLVLGVIGSSPKLLSFWREQTKETSCFFELVNLCDLEERLETI
ncbi:hypothetical protein [Brazilian marseillevirus]|uniref:hypothetical protein n=1 Tax=Brazilian marseillevirus TaxID=1813599 RepID=UPI00078637C1|nr:hypothetical protein A3303_gp427 [Brazilian marseillevirus]AMQ10935.1 hypothetical protein [Brazilian marseillevirus]